MTDWRGLCADLVAAWDSWVQRADVIVNGNIDAVDATDRMVEAANEARVELAKPYSDPAEERRLGYLKGLEDCAHAALAQPEPEGPTDKEPTDQEIEEWADAAAEVPLEEMDPEVHGWRRCFRSDEFSETIRAALARFGRPAIEPVPVAERLPGAEDCDELGQCWWWRDGEVAWFFCDANHRDFPLWTHWLPHYALPVPTSQENPLGLFIGNPLLDSQ